MSLALMLAFQASAAPAEPPSAVRPIDFDLAQYQPKEEAPQGACAGGDSNEVVVCGRRRASRGSYPLAEMARLFEPGRIVAETRLTGNLSGNIHVEQGPGDRGAPNNRVLVGLRLPF